MTFNRLGQGTALGMHFCSIAHSAVLMLKPTKNQPHNSVLVLYESLVKKYLYSPTNLTLAQISYPVVTKKTKIVLMDYWCPATQIQQVNNAVQHVLLITCLSTVQPSPDRSLAVSTGLANRC